MRKWFRKCMASLCAATIAFSGMYIVGNESTKAVKADGEYQLVWSDEFDGTETIGMWKLTEVAEEIMNCSIMLTVQTIFRLVMAH